MASQATLNLAFNESLWDVDPAVEAALWKHHTDPRKYPHGDACHGDLQRAFRAYADVPACLQLQVFQGSDAAITTWMDCVEARAGRKHVRCVAFAPTYAHFEEQAARRGWRLCGATHDAATDLERAECAYIATPNNPDGREPSVRYLRDLGARVPLLVDQAYAELGADVRAKDVWAVAAESPHVTVTRTMSKAFGLAGLRVGFAVGLRPLPSRPWTAVGCCIAACVAALQPEAVARTADKLEEAEHVREWMAAQLRTCAGVRDVHGRAGAFVYAVLDVPAADVAAACAKRNVTVRPCGDRGVRVSVCPMRHAERGFAALRAALEEVASAAGALDTLLY